MTVIGFVGASGTGKSHRALEIARRMNASCILDDGLLIRDNQVLAGISAKREASRLASVRRAMFMDQEHADAVIKALAAINAHTIMILGTSTHMTDSIAAKLKLPPISSYVDICDVATAGEIEAARSVRVTEGKHVIPAPTFALKKDFSGYFLEPLRRLARRGKTVVVSGGRAGASSPADAEERTVVRPTYSYLGRYTISRSALEQLACCVALKSEGIVEVTEVGIGFMDGKLDIKLSACIKYGVKIHDLLAETAKRLRVEVDRQTSLQIREITITADSLNITA